MRRAPATLALLLAAIALAGCTSPPPEPEPASDGEQDPPPQGTTILANAAPSWDPPAWRVGDRWTYALWRSEGTGEVRLEVVDAAAQAGGVPAYAVHRSADNSTAHFARATLNQLDANGTQERVYQWPLRDGAAWDLESRAAGRARVRAEFVHDIVTPVGLLDGYKITADYAERGLVEVFYYVQEYRSYVKVEDYNRGTLTLSLALTDLRPGA